jgi:hypothetical protein
VPDIRLHSPVLLACRLSRPVSCGDAERVFHVALSGSGEHTGVAWVIHCRRPNLEWFEADEPLRGESLDGLVEGRVVAIGGNGVIQVNLPDGQTVCVRRSLVRYFINPGWVPLAVEEVPRA